MDSLEASTDLSGSYRRQPNSESNAVCLLDNGAPDGSYISMSMDEVRVSLEIEYVTRYLTDMRLV